MNEDKTIEAEVVPTQAVAVRQQTGALASQTVEDLEHAFAMAVKQRELLSNYIRNQLQPGKHFYSRKDQKPSLTKEGAEIILLPHSLAPDYEMLSGPDQPPENDKPYQITVKCTLRPKGNPTAFVGSAIGSAGSHKGTWRGKDWIYQPRQTDRFLCHNATLKMAQKSALIAATINSTAASEFFTQDMEPENVQERDTPPKRYEQNRPTTNRGGAPQGEGQTHSNEGAEGRAREKAPMRSVRSDSGANAPSGLQQTSGGGVAMPHTSSEGTRSKTVAKLPTAATRSWMIKQLKADPDGPNRRSVTEYFEKIAQLLPGEPLEQIPLRFVAFSTQEINALVQCVANFADGGDAVRAFEPHDAEDKPVEVPRGPAPSKDDEYWRDIIIPIPRKDIKKDEYLRNPDTIGSLYDVIHDDEEARKRLWWLAKQWNPQPREFKGRTYNPTEADHKCRKALDDFCDWWAKNHPDEKL